MKTYTEQELRELDAEIAVKVFGWRIYKTTREWQADGSPIERLVIVLDQWPRHEFQNYSTDPAASMQVLEKCAEKLDGFEIVIGRHQYRVGEPDRFMVCSSNRREFQSIAPTLPLSICLFAKQLFAKDQ